MTLSLSDGALGDDTGIDGTIVGVGGPAEAVVSSVPLLQGWLVYILAGGLLSLGYFRLTRGRGRA